MFNKVLKHIFDSVEGIKLLAIFDKDGFIVDKVDNSERNADELTAEFSSILRYIDKVTTSLITSDMNRMMLECETEMFYLYKLNADYYIVAVLDIYALIGKLKFAIQLFEHQLRQELDIE